ncbi:hypothetical protein BC832DRAFT_548052 [Gaertneriomyces semiglobifer]|nr:hypothetical protein BC832DRAFT_548052 [Gaertneriomyces semiglobifer]
MPYDEDEDDDYGYDQQAYEDEIYGSSNLNRSDDGNSSSGSSIGSDDEDALAQVHYSHSFRFEGQPHNNDDEDAESNASGLQDGANNELLPEDVLGKRDADTLIEVDDISDSEEERNELHVSDNKKAKANSSKMRVVTMKSVEPVAEVELEELVGAGDEGPQVSRYFMEVPDIFCFFCRKMGHTAKNCSEREMECYLCHSDHDPIRCKLSNFCYRCLKRGHMSGDCMEPAAPLDRCSFCDGFHSALRCPTIWRQYIYTPLDPSIPPLSRKQIEEKVNIFCYQCAEPDHFGDHCTHPPGYGHMGGSRKRPPKLTAFNNSSLEQHYHFERIRAFNEGAESYVPPSRSDWDKRNMQRNGGSPMVMSGSGRHIRFGSESPRRRSLRDHSPRRSGSSPHDRQDSFGPTRGASNRGRDRGDRRRDSRSQSPDLRDVIAARRSTDHRRDEFYNDFFGTNSDSRGDPLRDDRPRSRNHRPPSPSSHIRRKTDAYTGPVRRNSERDRYDPYSRSQSGHAKPGSRYDRSDRGSNSYNESSGESRSASAGSMRTVAGQTRFAHNTPTPAGSGRGFGPKYDGGYGGAIKSTGPSRRR